MLELLAIFADEDFGGVEVELVIDREPFDERDIRLVLDLLAQLDFLDEPVEPKPNGGVGDAELRGTSFMEPDASRNRLMNVISSSSRFDIHGGIIVISIPASFNPRRV